MPERQCCQHPTSRKNFQGNYLCPYQDLVNYESTIVCKRHYNELMKDVDHFPIIEEVTPPPTPISLPTKLCVQLPYEEQNLLNKIATEAPPPSPPPKSRSKSSKKIPPPPSELDEELEEKINSPQKSIKSLLQNGDIAYMGIVTLLNLLESVATSYGVDITGLSHDLTQMKEFKDMSYAALDEIIPGIMNMDQFSPTSKLAGMLFFAALARYKNNKLSSQPSPEPSKPAFTE